jgi:hypothetical protein
MWFLIASVCITAAFAAIALAKSRRRRRRDRRMILGEMRHLVRLLDEPTVDPPIRFTRPHRSDEDRAHDTMFIASHGHIRLSFILDTSRMRIRWWVLYEIFAPEAAGSGRTLRVETDFIERAIPTGLIQALLRAARGELPAPPVETSLEAQAPARPDAVVDPFAPVTDTTAQT